MTSELTKHLWLPYSQMKTAPQPLKVARTEGSKITLDDGRVLLDGMASWWTACHGYNHPHIMAAMQRQMETLPHIMFGRFVHEPAITLAARLAALAPGDITRVFFVDSGSVAVEAALKMAVHYWINKGARGRTKFVSFRGGYHGDTLGCMGVSDPGDAMQPSFREWIPENYCMALPSDAASSAALDRCLGAHDDIAAVIIEPLVQGVGGMVFHDAATLKRVAEMCAKHQVLLIADEIATGFGRTGTMFACAQADVVPDILCVGKAITGGTVTLAAALARPHVFEAFWSDNSAAALRHGPTYMANPLACAAANASLDLFEREPRLAQVAEIERVMIEGLGVCRGLPNVVDVRVKGAIGVVQVAAIKDINLVRQALIDQGVWARAYGNVIYLTPAFTISNEDLQALIRAVVTVVKAL